MKAKLFPSVLVLLRFPIKRAESIMSARKAIHFISAQAGRSLPATVHDSAEIPPHDRLGLGFVLTRA